MNCFDWSRSSGMRESLDSSAFAAEHRGDLRSIAAGCWLSGAVLRRVTLALLLVSMVTAAQAQQPAPDLTTASLEDLMNIEVTSVSKKEEHLFQTAAAIYV